MGGKVRSNDILKKAFILRKGYRKNSYDLYYVYNGNGKILQSILYCDWVI